MKRFLFLFITGILACCALSGCYPNVERLSPQEPDQPWQSKSGSSSSAQPKFDLPADATLPDKRDDVQVYPQHIYSLPELIDLAEKSNKDTRIAWEESKQAAYAVGLVEANYLPQLSAEVLGGEERLPSPIPKPLSDKGYFIINGNEVLPSLVIQWLLFDFGKRGSLVEAAKQNSIASNVAFTGVHQKLIFEVCKAYFSFNAQQAQLHEAENALKSAGTVQDAAEAKGKTGLASMTEIDMARYATAKAQFDLEQEKTMYNDAYHSLLDTIGLTPTLQLQVADSSGRNLPESLAEDVNTYINRALARRPDIVAALAKLRASESEISAAKASYYPTLGFTGLVSENIGEININGGPEYRVNDPASAILLQISLPIFDGGLRENELRMARSKSAEAKEELNKAEDDAIRQVALSYDTVKATLAEYNSALALVKASNIAYSAALDSYRHGIDTFTDVMLTETGNVQAQSAQANAYASVLTAAAALAFSTGDLTSIDALNNPTQNGIN
jgi:outer membrane protein